ncbi:MAG: nucleotidyltransferase family protein [Clostridia bacterium]|nr:nucleotidyltransferase family protein [Clostridia bacterium]
MSEETALLYDPDMQSKLLAIAQKHDLAHLIVLALNNNGLITNDTTSKKRLLAAVYRYEQINHTFDQTTAVLEELAIPFVPLKGAVMRSYYPEPWMRTSCDIDILLHREDIDKAIAALTERLQYTVNDVEAMHDISLTTPKSVHVELHFDLVEEGRAQNAVDVLHSVWDNAVLRKNSNCWYEMTDAYFYFYHIAHMAKHFENGGCGIRPFIDLWLLEKTDSADKASRDKLLENGNLLTFANASRSLCEVWFGGKEHDELTLKMQDFILHGGVYGSSENRVALQQSKKGGRLGYLFSRIFIPYAKLKRYYPILEKHRWLTPFMQIRRWFMLLRPSVARMAKTELFANANIERNTADRMNAFLNDIGL